jgi:membrane-associated phospholipid phosphatase
MNRMFKKFAIFAFAITVAAPPALLNASDEQESQRTSANEGGRTCTDTNGNPEACPPDPEGIVVQNGKPPANHNGVSLRSLPRNLVQDQKSLWTAPAHFQKKDIKWIGPLAGITAGFIASDSWLSRQVPLGGVQRSKKISDYGAYSLIGTGAGSFLLGHITGNAQMSEAGLLSGEAAMNSTAVAFLLKSATQRPRPFQANGNGTFFQGGGAFPSEHAAIAWSIASVLAHEYPGTLNKIMVYGIATGVSAARVTGQQHFASDVLVGSALGWYFGRQVYRTHHDTDWGGATWGDALPDSSEDKVRNPENMGSPYVPLDSWVYSALDRLIALGYVKTAYLGMRPWTRMECARMLEETQQEIGDEGDRSGDGPRIYGELAKEFSAESDHLNGMANLGASLDSVYARATNISGPPLRDGYHFGQTIVNDFGRPFGEGTSFITGASAHAVAGPFAFYVRGEYQESPSVTPFTTVQLQAIAGADLLPSSMPGFSINTGSFSRFQFLEGSISLNLKNIQFSFGRQTAWLGPSEAGPFLYSNNAPPITMFKMDTTTPFEFPLLSKLFGPARAEFFVGRLSGHEWINSPPTLYGPYPGDQPFIHGNKISFKPTQNLEFGADFTAVFGGAGVPVTFGEFFRTYYSHTRLANNPGKRFSAFDFTYRIPGLRNWLTFYTDSLVVDEYSPISSSRPSLNPGIYMPQVPKASKLALRAEGLRESLTKEFQPGFVYIDGRYLSGYTNNGYLLGNWIGRAGRGGEVWATYSFSPRNNLQFSYRGQRVSHRFLEGGSTNDFSVTWEQTFRNQVSLAALFQYENWRFPLLRPDRQTNLTSSVQLTYWPNWRTK